MLWFRNHGFGGSLRFADHDRPPLQLLIILHLSHLLSLDLGSLGLPLNAIFDDVADLVNEELPAGNVDGGRFLWSLSYLKIRILHLSYYIDFRFIEIRTIKCPLLLSMSCLASFTLIYSAIIISVIRLWLVNGR